MAIATTLDWRRSALGNLSADTRFPSLEQRAATRVDPIWPVDAPSPLRRTQPARPDVTMLAVLWGRHVS